MYAVGVDVSNGKSSVTVLRSKREVIIVCFGSFQDFLGVNKQTGGIKANNEWVHTTNWDLVIFGEYHFGAWKENAKKLFEQDEDDYDEDLSRYDRGNAYDETWLPITTDYYLYLSGTPFRALNSGEFIEEQKTLNGLRNEFLAHNDKEKGENAISVSSLKSTLDDIRKCMNELCFPELDDRVSPIENEIFKEAYDMKLGLELLF